MSALYLRKAYAPSSKVFALAAIFTYASQKSCLRLCEPMLLEDSFSLSMAAARSADAMPALSARTRISCGMSTGDERGV